MARAPRNRQMPSTPQPGRQDAPPPATASPPPTTQRPPRAPRPAVASASRSSQGSAPTAEPEYLVAGTDCLAGHPPGQPVAVGRTGTVRTKRQARLGFGLVAWCVGGMAVLAVAGIVDARWATFGIQVGVIWLAFAALLVRRAGHRGRCWRTHSWRQAWGGLAPGSGPPRARRSRRAT